MRKYIFITGGAVSDRAKTVVASSLGLMLASRGFKVVNKKLNPYINITLDGLDPWRFGETFLTENGELVDSGSGFYERFTGCPIKENSFITAGKIYWSVINKERMGDYFGDAVTVSSHVTKEIKDFIYEKDENDEIVVLEVGGVAGESQSIHFMETIGEVREEKGADNVMYIHVENLAKKSNSDEEIINQVKNSLSSLRAWKIKPDVIVCEEKTAIEEELKEQLAVLCNVSKQCVIEKPHTDYVYEIPLLFEKMGFAAIVLKNLVLHDFKPKFDRYKEYVSDYIKADKTVKIALVGKYAKVSDAYLSVKEALYHGASSESVKLHVELIDAEDVNEETAENLLGNADGIVLPDGNGECGVEGMLATAKYARENDIPFFAIGQGMHMAVVELAQNVLGFKDAQSLELASKTAYPVIKEAEQPFRGSRRLHVLRNTIAYSAYKRELFYERHRQRYVINNAYIEKLREAGMYITGEIEEKNLCEITELVGKRWYVGTQFNPEFNSRISEPHPLFKAFIKEAKASCKKV